MSQIRYVEPPPQWEDHEKPILPGSPAALAHSAPMRVAYALVAALVGLTGGLGSAIVLVNLPFIQGEMGLTPSQAAWLPAAYMVSNITSNLLLYKYRQRFGMRNFAELGLAIYAILALLHMGFAHDFAISVALRAASGFAAGATTTLAVLYMLQAFPRPMAPQAIIVALATTQLATPLAWIMSPQLLELELWPTLYSLEAGLAICAFAAVVVLKLPTGVRMYVFEPLDFVSFILVAAGIALFGGAMYQGLYGWWTDSPWIAWAFCASIALLFTVGCIEANRKNPLIHIKLLANTTALRFVLGALLMRFMLSEQSYGAIGFLRSLGMGPDQLQHLFVVILLGMICGALFSAITFSPARIVWQILLSLALISIGAFIDHSATSLSRPQEFYVSQFLIAFAQAMFLGPIMLTGFGMVLKMGPQYFVTIIVLFSASQNLGGLMGPALLGTYQIERTAVYTQAIYADIPKNAPAAQGRLSLQAGALAGRITDPAVRTALATQQLRQVVQREASVRGYNDVFVLLGALAGLYLLWSWYMFVSEAKRAARAARAAVS